MKLPVFAVLGLSQDIRIAVRIYAANVDEDTYVRRSFIHTSRYRE